MLSWGSKKVLGLDIGTSTIKLAEVDVSRSSATLNAFAMAPTPPGSVVAGAIMDPMALAQTVAGLTQDLNTKRKSVAASLWGSSVIVKKISIPKMDEKVVGEQIRWEAEQYIPFDINEVNLAFKILRNLNHGGETMDILIVAAKQEQTMKYIEVVETAGLKCSILDVGGFALANCFERNFGVLQGQVVSVLNIGASTTNLVIIENGEVVFCRDLEIGGKTYTDEIQKALSVSAEEAESIKLTASSGQAVPEEVPQILKQAHELVCDELQASFDFFANTNSNSAIAKCFVTGGGSRVPGFLAQLTETVKISSEPFDPFSRISYNSRNISSSYLADIRDFAAVALGLGVRKVGD